MSNSITSGHEETRSSASAEHPSARLARADNCGDGLRDATDSSYDGLELPTEREWWLSMGREELMAELSADCCARGVARPLPGRFEDLPEVPALLPKVVIGDDDRRQIHSTTDYPWRCICSLIVTAQNGLRFPGTGWLAGPSTVVTAGHVVFLHDHGGWARSIEVIPGRNGDIRPHGSVHGTVLRSVTGWTEGRDRSFDYGAILLPPAPVGAMNLGERLGFFGFTSLSRNELQQLEINLSGYPTDKPAGTLWWQARRLESVADRTLTYNIDTGEGQSGSPLWRADGGVRQAVGIHVRGIQSGNVAVRINSDVFHNITQWAQ